MSEFMSQAAGEDRPVLGWREWVSLPRLGVPTIKAKIDTGACSSALHVFGLDEFSREGKVWVRFQIHPIQRNGQLSIPAEAELLEYRRVRSSTGHDAWRPVIVTDVGWGGLRWSIELTLASRDEMGFRMLLGRRDVRGRFVVDPAASYTGGLPPQPPRRRRPGKH